MQTETLVSGAGSLQTRTHLGQRATRKVRHALLRATERRIITSVAAPEAPITTAPVTGLVHLSPEARERSIKSKVKFEKVKVEKCGSNMWTEVPELAKLIREGNTKWEDLNLDDVDIRMKWAGLFHRSKRTPGKFMMRIRVPSGELSAAQLRFLGSAIRVYGEEGCGDITTRAGIQLRGITLDTADKVIEGLLAHGLTSFQSGMDNVRNLTGNPIAGLDPHELIDTRPLLKELQDMIVGPEGKGRADLTNLPRKINVCISSTRDDFPHTQINDVGFEAVQDPASGKVVFNLMVGGYFSIKRNIMSVPAPFSVTEEQLVPFTEALLASFRDHGPRADRQQTRLIWLVEAIGMEKWQELIESYMPPGTKLAPAVHVKHEGTWERRDLLGVHPQKQPGLNWVGACVPSGRLLADDFDEIARLAEKYGDGSVRLTCEENVLFVNVPDASVQGLLAEPLLQRFKANPGNLTRAMVSCTGSQFCGFGLAETKNRAMALMQALEEQLDIPRPVRIHFTGCPNSCGQAQVGDIGLMGAPAKKNGKAVEGYKILLGGKVGENPSLATDFAQCQRRILKPGCGKFWCKPLAQHPRLPQLLHRA
uniref:Ferredoxin--nitrite reductase, chloroplastic n=1 Tax=Haematococcus lacustris TaxID=44745 RepID=A0A482KHT8_HAELA|nr:ferredoxin-nitrite reductase [Haematococcus lacustris]